MLARSPEWIFRIINIRLLEEANVYIYVYIYINIYVYKYEIYNRHNSRSCICKMCPHFTNFAGRIVTGVGESCRGISTGVRESCGGISTGVRESCGGISYRSGRELWRY